MLNEYILSLKRGAPKMGTPKNPHGNKLGAAQVRACDDRAEALSARNRHLSAPLKTPTREPLLRPAAVAVKITSVEESKNRKLALYAFLVESYRL